MKVNKCKFDIIENWGDGDIECVEVYLSLREVVEYYKKSHGFTLEEIRDKYQDYDGVYHWEESE